MGHSSFTNATSPVLIQNSNSSVTHSVVVSAMVRPPVLSSGPKPKSPRNSGMWPSLYWPRAYSRNLEISNRGAAQM